MPVALPNRRSNAECKEQLERWYNEINLQKEQLRQEAFTAADNVDVATVALIAHMDQDPKRSTIVLPMLTIDDTIKKYTLNLKQEMAVRIVLEHFTQHHNGSNPAQLKMAIMGEPGVGKSVVAAAIAAHLAQHKASNEIVLTAYTGIFDSRVTHLLTLLKQARQQFISTAGPCTLRWRLCDFSTPITEKTSMQMRWMACRYGGSRWCIF